MSWAYPGYFFYFTLLEVSMLEEYNPLSKIPDNSKAGITIRLNQKETDEPFEATVYFKKSGKNPEELCEEGAINLTVSGKLRLDIGNSGFVEIFAERTGRLKDNDTGDDETGNKEETDDDTMPVL
jgi:hypothetical protein